MEYLRSPAKLTEQRESLGRLVRKLDSPGASLNVARMALEMLNGARPDASNDPPPPRAVQHVSAVS